MTPNDGRQLIMNLPDGSISIGCLPLGGYGSRVAIAVRPEDLDELIAALMEAKDRTLPAVLWNEAAKGYLRCEPDETHEPIWDDRIEQAHRYPTIQAAEAARERLFEPATAAWIEARHAAR
jgi:hypothetical protein